MRTGSFFIIALTCTPLVAVAQPISWHDYVVPESEAKMAKCDVQQLGDAGFHIVLSAPDEDGAFTVTRGAVDSTTESSANG
jgi:hypothetical protein